MTTAKPAANPLEGVTWDLSGKDTYGSYLKLPQLLSLQQPYTEEHDELLFVIIHQTAELWIKLMLHELHAARRQIIADDLEPAFKMMSRVARIQMQLLQAWEVLATMTPSDYASFRNSLGTSSGFQSHQYRLMEYLLGQRNADFNKLHEGDSVVHGHLVEEMGRPSLYDESVRLLARRGFDIPESCLERDWSRPYAPSPAVERAWLEVYRDATEHWDLYELAEKLVDIEYRFQQWRFVHMKTVERIIGFKRGTGGSAGVAYLKSVLEKGFFPELLSLRTSI